MSAKEIALGEKPKGWTQKQHIDAAQMHGSERTDFKEKLQKARASWQRKSNATLEDEAKHRKKIERLEA